MGIGGGKGVVRVQWRVSCRSAATCALAVAGTEARPGDEGVRSRSLGEARLAVFGSSSSAGWDLQVAPCCCPCQRPQESPKQ